mmetsp:Transcript_10832/g.21734  ORF Transcript_10832/g.21734 Transcript_10832/m.21734 type:complete len:124 (-) Transcript_10832:357-728(-)
MVSIGMSMDSTFAKYTSAGSPAHFVRGGNLPSGETTDIGPSSKWVNVSSHNPGRRDETPTQNDEHARSPGVKRDDERKRYLGKERSFLLIEICMEAGHPLVDAIRGWVSNLRMALPWTWTLAS